MNKKLDKLTNEIIENTINDIRTTIDVTNGQFEELQNGGFWLDEKAFIENTNKMIENEISIEKFTEELFSSIYFNGISVYQYFKWSLDGEYENNELIKIMASFTKSITDIVNESLMKKLHYKIFERELKVHANLEDK